RGRVADRAGGPREEGAVEQARADLIDLALLWSDLKRRLRPGDESARAEAREVLAEAETLCGPSAALARERQALGGAAPQAQPAGRTPWERLALGRSLLRAGDLDGAAAELALAAEMRPQDFWAHFYGRGCAYPPRRHARAL